MVSVRKMHADEVSEVTAVADAGGKAARLLRQAVTDDPHAIRVVHMGSEVLGAFLRAEIKDQVEEVSCLTLNEEGRRTGAERALLDYVVKAARFSRKRAVEVLAVPRSSEALHLESMGFDARGPLEGELARYRLVLRGKQRPGAASGPGRGA